MSAALDTGTEDLVAEIEGQVAILTFNRPERRNALSIEMYEGFARVLPVIARQPEIRVLMLTGAGGAFCAGGDVKGMNQAHRASTGSGQPSEGLDERVDLLRRYQQAVSLALHRFPKPVIAAIPGAAAGAGLSIALACDIRLAADTALIVTAFANIGAPGDFGGSWFLTHLVGTAKARELYFTSPRLSATEALDLGLVNQVFPADNFLPSAVRWCAALAERAPIALRLMKENLNRALTCDLTTALDAEAANMVRAMTTADHREAAAAFVDKRTPEFLGR